MDELDSDDEWITKKEDLLSIDLCWLEDNELFNVDVIRVVSFKDQETQALPYNMGFLHNPTKDNIMNEQIGTQNLSHKFD